MCFRLKSSAKVQKIFDICKFISKIYTNPYKIAEKGRREVVWHEICKDK